MAHLPIHPDETTWLSVRFGGLVVGLLAGVTAVLPLFLFGVNESVGGTYCWSVGCWTVRYSPPRGSAGHGHQRAQSGCTGVIALTSVNVAVGLWLRRI